MPTASGLFCFDSAGAAASMQAAAEADATAGDQCASKGCTAAGDPDAILGGLFIGIF